MPDPIPASVRKEIQERLRAVAAEEGVQVCYACESGSRAWGFPSADSDYDVRFLYLRPRTWYLSIDVEHRRDVIERPIMDEIDLVGWDVRKALGLFYKSNPPLLEWLRSPIVYREVPPLAARLRTLAETFYSPRRCFYHYLSMAKNNFRSYARGGQIKHKKYLYILRPVLACQWLEQGRGLPPMAFDDLYTALIEPGPLADEIDDLLARKRAGRELDLGPLLPHLHAFLAAEIARLDTLAQLITDLRPEMEPLNALFREMVEVKRES